MLFKLFGKYSKHVAFISALLGLQHKVRLQEKNIDQPDDVKAYYKSTLVLARTLVHISCGDDFFLSCCDSWEDFNNDKCEEEIELHLNESLHQSEIVFYKALADHNILHSLFPFSEDTVRSTISYFYNRTTRIHEVVFHAHNPVYTNNTFLWLIILCFCDEGRLHKHHNRIRSDSIHNQYKNKKIAVMLCGHVRKVLNHIERQNVLFKYPHVDVFIHTWDDYGLKNHKHCKAGTWLQDNQGKINVDFLNTHYSPKKMIIENNASILSSMSLIGKINPIFLYNGQAHDDATKYINSQLYSINKCFELVKEYEKEHNFKYDGVMKFRFDYVPTSFDMDTVIYNIEDGALWFPHAQYNHHRHFGGGGGCMRCDFGGDHGYGGEHTNDLCDIWYYGKRDLMEKACELYHAAPSILEKHTENNIRVVKELNIKTHISEPFVYVISTANIEKHVVCYYPERLLREHLRDITCRSCDAIRGGIV